MNILFEQTLSLLTIPPGNLVFHLVLFFALLATLQVTWLHRQTASPSLFRRMSLGLLTLLAIQFGLFLASGLAWQGLLNAPVFLPPFDRFLGAIALLTAIWLWSFPSASRDGDLATGVLAVITASLFALTISQWMLANTGAGFNQSWLQDVWLGLSALVAVVGLALIAIRQPIAWQYGVAFCGLHLIGLALQFFIAPPGDFSGLLRLAQLAAYPLLPTLAARLLTPAPAPAASAAAPAASKAAPKSNAAPAAPNGFTFHERRRYTADVRTLSAWLDGFASDEKPMHVAHAISRTLVSDLCFIVELAADSSAVRFQTGYDLIQEIDLPGFQLRADLLPAITGSLQRNRGLILLDALPAPADLLSLSEALNLERAGNLLLLPISGRDGSAKTAQAALLLSPYSTRAWTLEDQNYLTPAMPAIARFLQHTPPTAAPLEATGLVSDLQAENEKLRILLAQAPTSEQLERELRATLEELAELQNDLVKANVRIMTMERNMRENPPQVENLRVFTALVQEIRQPLSSIVGYTELLLSESAGILGASQRRFIERVRASSDRLRALVDQLLRLTASSTGPVELLPQRVNMLEIIDQALADVSAQIEEKDLALNLDLIESLPPLSADIDAMHQVVSLLLGNACVVTPAGGQISLRVRTHSELDGDYFLLEVEDQGGGIPTEDLARVFNGRLGNDVPPIPGVGDNGVGLSIVQTLIEAHGGRVWAQSDPQRGSSKFSVLLSLPPSVASEGLA